MICLDSDRAGPDNPAVLDGEVVAGKGKTVSDELYAFLGEIPGITPVRVNWHDGWYLPGTGTVPESDRVGGCEHP